MGLPNPKPAPKFLPPPRRKTMKSTSPVIALLMLSTAVQSTNVTIKMFCSNCWKSKAVPVPADGKAPTDVPCTTNARCLDKGRMMDKVRVKVTGCTFQDDTGKFK